MICGLVTLIMTTGLMSSIVAPTGNGAILLAVPVLGTMIWPLLPKFLIKIWRWVILMAMASPMSSIANPAGSGAFRAVVPMGG
jgi:hypothetical protein